MAELWAAWLLLCFAVLAGVVAGVKAIGAGEYLAALAFTAIALVCAVGAYVPIRSRRVRRWWW